MNSAVRFVLLAVLAPAAHSQSVLYEFFGDSVGDGFGFSVSAAGDVNGDGYADVIVGADRDDNNGTDSGMARVLSGVDGSALFTFDGNAANARFGFSVSGAGDVNGDGFDDLIVGAPVDKNNTAGTARVLSGIDGSTLYTFAGDAAKDGFALSVSGAGDVNGDGFDDLIVGAPGDDNNGIDSGSARVFSGLNGSVLYTFDGDSKHDRFGMSVSGAEDVNGDGFEDMIVGAYRADPNLIRTGIAKVFSGVDGSVLYTFEGDSANDEFGRAVSGAGDVNGDGFADLIVGAHLDDNVADLSGSARVLSGIDGSVLYTFDGDALGPASDCFGWSVSGAGDVDGDGFDDLIVGASCWGAGGHGGEYARVFSGANGSVLYTLYWDQWKTYFGISVSGAGDVNGDGFDDVIVGNLTYSGKVTQAGRAQVYSGWSPVGTNYCGPAVANSTGLPASILAVGSHTAADNILWLRATDMPQDKFGYFLVSPTPAFIPNPAGSQGNLCLGEKIGRFTKQVQSSGSNGLFTIKVDLTSIPPNPPHTVVAGETWNFQAWYRDKNPGSTSNFTEATAVTFQ